VEGQHHAWCEAGIQAFLLGDDRGVSARALKAHLAAVRTKTGQA
jgi:4-hydroxy-2-oxoheptanedioate aldolase